MEIFYKRVKEIKKSKLTDYMYFSQSKTMFDEYMFLRLHPLTPECQILSQVQIKLKIKDIKLIRIQ